MKKIITKVAVAAILAFGVNPLYGGAGHDHSHSSSKTKINEAKAKDIALKEMRRYVINGKLDKSWEGAPVNSAKQQVYKSIPEWVVTFKNPKESKPEQQNLYVFVSQYGEIMGANFTGE
jgi:hypothetical protein